MRQKRPGRGVAFVVVLAVLMILSLLAVTFAQIAALDRGVAKSYLDGVRARLVARAGVEHAVHEIGQAVERGIFLDCAMQYWGSNTAEEGDLDLAVPLEKALNPSYAYEQEDLQNPSDEHVEPAVFELDGARAGISGTAGGTYARNADVYRLRVTDANSRIYINDGLAGGPEGPVSRNLGRILDNLGDLIKVEKLGERIVTGRPAQGYRSNRELKAVLGTADFERSREFLTTAAWVDRNAINPVPLSAETLSAYPVRYNERIGLYRYGRSRNSAGQQITGAPLRFAPDFADPLSTDHVVLALDEVNAQWIERTERAPVNVNLASKEILTALVIGLRGWFLVERRRMAPGPDMYWFLYYPKMDNVPGGTRGDEMGYLYSTPAFTAPGKTSAGGVDASWVADEIVACRSKRRSPHVGSLDYASVWYGGPFRTWRQFYAFCDALADGGLLRDPRPIFYDWRGMDLLGGSREPSLYQEKVAARAMADVLKANFNPNCALNELNPDENLHLLVDKTDLVCNSTEFCFTPMGIFDIESEGLILRTPGDADFLSVKEGTVTARGKIQCVAKAFDVIRQTTQADFREGEPGARPAGSAIGTNNDRTMEIGPEPDAGPAPKECRWSGWIQLSTVGGPAGMCGAENAAAHGHFSTDHSLHQHAGGQVAPVPGTGQCRNNPDRTETAPGPYGPLTDAPGKYRLARDWRSSRGTAAAAAYSAPGDLRLDGAYVERDSALMFVNDLKVFGKSGTVAFWVKPSFRPEMSGKPRTWFSMDTIKMERSYPWQVINGVWFFPSHDAPALAPSVAENRSPAYSMGPWRPASVVCGYSTASDWGGGVGSASSSLNHRGHGDCDQRNLLDGHRWTHVTYAWDMNAHRTRLLINGDLPQRTAEINIHPGNVVPEDYANPNNPLRLGEPSQTAGSSQSRNWAADATIDEFYLWNGNGLTAGQDQYARGRYYRARQDREASFTSGPFRFSTAVRQLPPPSSAAPPEDLAPSPPPASSTVSGARILGAAWTLYPESNSAEGKPQIRDYNSDVDLEIESELALLVGGKELPAVLKDDGGSGISDAVAEAGTEVRYRLRVRLRQAGPDVILLATPVVDDVTLYVTTGIEYISYGTPEMPS